MVHRVECAWCGRFMDGDPASPARSHGICADCLQVSDLAQVELIEDMDDEVADALPFGLLRLDESGRVIRYNLPESRISGRQPESVLGKHFFSEVAPCTRVKAFEGRFKELIAAGVAAREEFSFVFQFKTGSRLVHVVMVYLPSSGVAILVEDREIGRAHV